MAWLALIPRWLLAAVAAAALATAGVQSVRLGGANRTAMKAQRDLAQLQAAAEAAARQHEADQRAAVAAAQRDAKRRSQAAVAAAGGADAALAGLLDRAAESGSDCAAGTAAAGSPAAPSAADLHADMLRRLGQAAAELAAEADRRGIAGSACEQAHTVGPEATE